MTSEVLETTLVEGASYKKTVYEQQVAAYLKQPCSPFIIGLTGGIGSGKTTASDYLGSLGAHVVDTDIISRQVVMPNTYGLNQIIGKFGSSILQEDGTLNRASLRAKVFSDFKTKKWLESLLHPLIGKKTQEEIGKTQSSYCLMVVPLLFETNGEARCHLSLLVDTNSQHQLERTLKRDSSPKDVIKKIIASQMAPEQKREKATIRVINSGTLNSFHQQLDSVHQLLSESLKQRHS